MFYTIFKIIALLIFISLIIELIIYFYPIVDKEYPIFNKYYSKKIYKKWDFISLPIFIFYMVVISFIVFIILYIILIFIYKNNLNNLIIANTNYFFTLPSMLLGIILAIIPMRLTLKFLLKKDYDEYISYNKLMHKFSSNKYIKFFKFSIILISLLLIILGFNWYVYYNDNTLKINNFLNIKANSIEYKDIRKIYLIRNNKKSNGDYIYKKHYLIELKNGKEIDLQKTLLDNKNFEDKILPLIITKNKLNIKTIESLDDK